MRLRDSPSTKLSRLDLRLLPEVQEAVSMAKKREVEEEAEAVVVAEEA